MANLKSSEKDVRRIKKHTIQNKRIITAMKSSIKKTQKTNDSKDLALTYKKIDSALAKGKIKKNKANRLKSRLAIKLNHSKVNQTQNEVKTA